tara:strand:+ start:472 stop:1035 length:564 start_codon:yes stop_codon:yes gene_type:complete
LKILIVDNNDSFTYNLKHYVEQFSCEVIVIKGSDLSLSNIDLFDKIILSPGPGLPLEHIVLNRVIERAIGKKSILGICLGHQAIAAYFGANLVNLKEVKHGVTSRLNQFNNCSLFKGIPNYFDVAHYHSWVVDERDFPECLLITSRNEEQYVMSFRHRHYDFVGLQFHPESILTDNGLQIIENWVLS